MIWGHYNRLQWGAQDTNFTKIPGCENYAKFMWDFTSFLIVAALY